VSGIRCQKGCQLSALSQDDSRQPEAKPGRLQWAFLVCWLSAISRQLSVNCTQADRFAISRPGTKLLFLTES
jgi:hypothetical protein